jgi:hypothetical protein
LRTECRCEVILQRKKVSLPGDCSRLQSIHKDLVEIYGHKFKARLVNVVNALFSHVYLLRYRDKIKS